MTTVPPVNQRATVSATLVENMDDQPPGAFEFYSRGDEESAGILFMCPCGCGQMHAIGFGKSERPSWGWNGEREKPTVTPSVLIYQMEKGTGKRIGEHWHGWLTDGVWRSC